MVSGTWPLPQGQQAGHQRKTYCLVQRWGSRKLSQGVLCLVTQSCLTLCNPWTTCQAPLSMEILQARILERVATLSPGHLPNPGIEARSPTLQEESLPSVPPGKPKNTGVGSLSLLQGLFPTQESNPGLPHCRQLLYQLSYQYLPRKFT